MEPGFFTTLRVSLKRLGFLRSLSLYIMLKDEERRFIKTAKSKEEKRLRLSILSQIKNVYKNILCLHFPLHFIVVAKFILDLEVDGPIVECGAFKGGSTAQLSVIAKKTNRKLYVCDSFQGLPAPSLAQESKVKVFNDSRTHTFQEGDYAATIEEVRSNVAKYGYIDVCEFIPGFFDKTLLKLNVDPAVVVLDVDLISSARDCLKYLWPQLKKGGYVFTHEAESEIYIKGLMDKNWWREMLGECPPLIFGAGSSLSPVAEGLAVLEKE
jgi:O-methyltransferase